MYVIVTIGTRCITVEAQVTFMVRNDQPNGIGNGKWYRILQALAIKIRLIPEVNIKIVHLDRSSSFDFFKLHSAAGSMRRGYARNKTWHSFEI